VVGFDDSARERRDAMAASRTSTLAPLVVALGLLTSPLPAAAQSEDLPGSADHPIVSRYAGSVIDGYEVHDFSDYDLPLGAAIKDDAGNRVPSEKESLEGRVTRILYRGPEGRSTLEMIRNYRSALEGAGFEVRFSCSEDECGRLFPWVLYHGDSQMKTRQQGGFDHAKELRYLNARKSTSRGLVNVSVMVAFEPIFTKRPVTLLELVESEAMETGMVTVDAEAMGKGIDATGHIALYGIYFDTGSDRIRPESGPTLDEVARLLVVRPSLSLLVVGHTDAQGGYDYNLDLSERRAEAVVRALVDDRGIAAGRLRAAGVGFLAPVATNDTDAGRAKNRRVVLVKN
jgi:OOP family OmpA-OmpF porin